MLAGLLVSIFTVWTPGAAYAEDPLTARVSGIENKFPDEVVFSASAQSSAGDVRSLVLRMVIGSGAVERYGAVDIKAGPSVSGKYTLKSGGNNFIVAGANIAYWLEAEDSAGNKITTPRQDLWYADTRFEWKSVSDGSVTVHYYRNAEPLARDILTAAKETERKSGGLLGTAGRPFKLMLYNTPSELIGAQRPEASATRAQEILRVGVAYAGEDVVQVYGGGTLGAQDTARHEITHLFEHWAAGNNIPAWLDEGLAVWGQSDPGPEYKNALNRAIAADNLLLLRGLDSFPGRSDETILAYGQSWSVVKYLIDTYGPEKYRQVYEHIRAGQGAADGIQQVYGFNADQLEAQWRQSVGAKPRTNFDTSVPTPVSINIQPIGANQAPRPGETSSGSGAAAGTGFPPFLLAGAAVGVGLLVLVGGAAVVAFARRR